MDTPPLVVLVTGGRDYFNKTQVFAFLDEILAEAPKDHLGRAHLVIVNGGAAGADRLSSEWSRSRGVECRVYPADWKTHGKDAGSIRNRLMFSKERPSLVVAFPGGNGTAHAISLARKFGIPLRYGETRFNLPEKKMTRPTVGRIVNYRLSKNDLLTLASERPGSMELYQLDPVSGKEVYAGNCDRRDLVAERLFCRWSFGNPLRYGEEYPMLIVRVKENGSANGQLFLDGSGTAWICESNEGTGPGTWSWPVRSEEKKPETKAPKKAPIPETIVGALQESRAALLNPELSNSDNAAVVKRIEGAIDLLKDASLVDASTRFDKVLAEKLLSVTMQLEQKLCYEVLREAIGEKEYRRVRFLCEEARSILSLLEESTGA